MMVVYIIGRNKVVSKSFLLINFFLLYCLHIITVNVFHVETGKQIFIEKERKRKLGYDVVV